jgi:predicted PurR-regulated permease PerM
MRTILIVVLMAALVACSAWILKPFIPAFIWAVMIVIASWTVMRDVERHVGGRRAVAVTLMILAIVLLLVVPLAIAAHQFVEHFDDIRAGFEWLNRNDIPPPPDWVSRIPLIGQTLAGWWNDFASRDPMSLLRPLLPYAGNIATWVAGRAGSLGLLLIDLLLIVVFSAILYTVGEVAARGAMHCAWRLAGERGTRATTLAAQAVRAVALGIIVTAAVQAVIAGVGLAIAGIPNASLLTAVMFVLCLAQIGAVPVLAPIAIWMFWKDSFGWGSFLVVWCVVVGALDNILRPVLIRRGADLPLLLVMVGVIGGLLGFGVVGLFVGPVVLAVTFTLVKAWIEEGEPMPEAHAPVPPRAPPAARPRKAKRGR